MENHNALPCACSTGPVTKALHDGAHGGQPIVFDVERGQAIPVGLCAA